MHAVPTSPKSVVQHHNYSYHIYVDAGGFIRKAAVSLTDSWNHLDNSTRLTVDMTSVREKGKRLICGDILNMTPNDSCKLLSQLICTS